MQINKDATLTIKGTGSLIAAGRNNTAGIGAPRSNSFAIDPTSKKVNNEYRDGGNLIIESGIINAFGAGAGAGIGASYRTKFGNITINGGSVTVNSTVCENDIEIRVRTGDVQLCDVRCGTLRSSGSTGDIRLKNVLAAEEIHIERSTGDVAFEDADAAELFVETDTGDVSGSLCSEKMFLTESNTGDIRVPASIAGGTCRIITSTGDITITVQ